MKRYNYIKSKSFGPFLESPLHIFTQIIHKKIIFHENIITIVKVLFSLIITINIVLIALFVTLLLPENKKIEANLSKTQHVCHFCVYKATE